MKRLIVSAALILVLAGLCAAHLSALGRLTGELDALLAHGAAMAAMGDLPGAEPPTRQAMARWEGRSFYLHAVLRHDDVDGVLCSFREALSALSAEDPAGYAAAVARLRLQLSLLTDGERPVPENVL